MWLCDSRLKCCSRDHAAAVTMLLLQLVPNSHSRAAGSAGRLGGKATHADSTGPRSTLADPAVPPNGQDLF